MMETMQDKMKPVDDIIDIHTPQYIDWALGNEVQYGDNNTSLSHDNSTPDKIFDNIASDKNSSINQWYVKKQPLAQFNKVEKLKVDQFESLQKWHGYVTSIEDNTIIARLKDITNGGIEEEAEFPLSLVDNDDRPLVKLGAIFYWNVGYRTIKGTRSKASVIRFRRRPNLTREQKDRIFRLSEAAFNEINWE